ncbi:MAG: diguanylate cyclase (GGDEF)-like protein/PAS domain S-box-containing protein [Pseudohongiellaceae bacterium]|jgi:diguanylate cyclase (GGDEF)-like protein/PAS domain S-box-containing protein
MAAPSALPPTLDHDIDIGHEMAETSDAEHSPEAMSLRIRGRLVRLVMNRIFAQLPVHVAGCAIIVPVLWSKVSGGALLSFSLAVIAIAALTAPLLRRTAERKADDERCAQLCMVASGLLGLCWGLGYYAIADDLDPARRTSCMLVLATLGLAAGPILSGLAGASSTFVFSLFAPVAAWHLTLASQAELHLALASTVFPAALVLVMGRTRATARRGMETQADKEQLTHSLNREIQEHRRHERYYRSLLENSSDLITVRGPQGDTLYESPSGADLIGADDSTVRFALDRIHLEDRDAVENVRSNMGDQGSTATQSLEFRLKDKDGLWREMEAQARLLKDGPVKGAVVFSSRDVTARKHLARQLARQHGLMRAIIDAAPDPIFYKDLEGRYLGCNGAYEKAMGHTLEQLKGQTDRVMLNEQHAARVAARDREVTEGGAVLRTDEWVDTPDGKRLLLDTIKAPILDDQGECIGIVGVCRDITENKLLQDKLRELAVTDGLTGLMNRRRLDEVLGAEWARARRHGSSMSLLMIDIDHFKAFNDHYGHPEGDAVLTRIAKVLRDAVQRPGDAVARYGGEEFTVVLPLTHAMGARAIAQRIQDQLASENIVNVASPVGARVTLSIGLACMIPGPEQPASELIAAADGALYGAKEAGRDQIAMAAVVTPESDSAKEPHDDTGSLFPDLP